MKTIQENRRTTARLGIKREQFALGIIHARRPNAALSEILDGTRVVRHGYIRVHRPLSGPVLEARMQWREFFDVVPDSFEYRADDSVGSCLVAGQIDVIGVDAGVLYDGGGLTALKPMRIIPGDSAAQALFALS